MFSNSNSEVIDRAQSHLTDRILMDIQAFSLDFWRIRPSIRRDHKLSFPSTFILKALVKFSDPSQFSRIRVNDVRLKRLRPRGLIFIRQERLQRFLTLTIKGV